MQKFEVTYECQNKNCRYQYVLEIEAISKAAAWKTSSASCPSHEMSGDMLPVKVKALGK